MIIGQAAFVSISLINCRDGRVIQDELILSIKIPDCIGRRYSNTLLSTQTSTLQSDECIANYYPCVIVRPCAVSPSDAL